MRDRSTQRKSRCSYCPRPSSLSTLNELETLRDEGIELSQRLTKLRNESYYTVVVKGTVQAMEVNLPTEVPEIRIGMLHGIA